MTRTLLDITRDLEALDALMGEVDRALEETEGEVTPEVQKVLGTVDAWMAELDADLGGKIDNYAALITELRGRAEVRKAESDRLSRRAKIDERNARWLADRLRDELDARGVGKVETPRYRVSVAANGGKLPLVIADEQALAHDRRFWVTVQQLNRSAVRDALDSGETVPGARLGERGRRLSIR